MKLQQRVEDLLKTSKGAGSVHKIYLLVKVFRMGVIRE